MAAGEGRRLGAGLPKALVPLGGRPLGSYAVEALSSHPRVSGLVLGVPAGREAAFAEALVSHAGDRPVRLVEGGGERQDTVLRALAAVPADADLVLVHDAARPFLSGIVIDRVLAAAGERGAAAPALAPADTLVGLDDSGEAVSAPPRDRLAALQTPQAFAADLLREAHRWARSAGRRFTDDFTLVMAYLGEPSRPGRAAGGPGPRPALVPGDPDLRKVTVSADLAWAETRAGATSPRVGLGVDYHRFAAGRRLVLGGVEIAHPRGLLGHSDADVVAHAVADALLGAAALGDIGRLFPDSDPAFEGADSIELLRDVAHRLAARGWRTGNVDVTVIAQEPRIAPHADRMRARLAEAVGVGPDRISVKATTSEGLGEVGRGEGIRAEAVAMIRRDAFAGGGEGPPATPGGPPRGTVRP